MKVNECMKFQLWYGCKEMNALNYNECMEMNAWDCKYVLNVWKRMYFMEALYVVLSSLIVSEVTGWGLKGQEWYPRSSPQAYFHLLYLEYIDNEHSRELWGSKLELHWVKTFETWKL